MRSMWALSGLSGGDLPGRSEISSSPRSGCATEWRGGGLTSNPPCWADRCTPPARSLCCTSPSPPAAESPPTYRRRPRTNSAGAGGSPWPALTAGGWRAASPPMASRGCTGRPPALRDRAPCARFPACEIWWRPSGPTWCTCIRRKPGTPAGWRSVRVCPRFSSRMAGPGWRRTVRWPTWHEHGSVRRQRAGRMRSCVSAKARPNSAAVAACPAPSPWSAMERTCGGFAQVC